MAKSRQQKSVTVEALTEAFKKAKSVMFADYQGLTVAQADDLRKQMRAAGVTYVVAKKSLIGLAAKQAGVTVDAKSLSGMIGVAFGMEDEVAPAKVVGDLSKKTTVKLVGGVFEGAAIGADKAVAISKIPSKQQLLGQLVSVVAGPMSGFVRALNAIKEKQEAPAAA